MRAQTAPGERNCSQLPTVDKTPLTGVQREEEEGGELPLREGEDQEADNTSLESQEETLSVGAEREVVTEPVHATEGDGNQLQEDAHEADSLRTPASNDLEDLRHFDQATPDNDAEAQSFRDGGLDAVCIRDVEIDNDGLEAVRGHQSQIEYQVTQLANDIHPKTLQVL